MSVLKKELIFSNLYLLHQVTMIATYRERLC